VIQKVAFVLIGGGVLTALGFSMWLFITAPDLALIWKIILGIVVVGIFLMLVQAGWERYRASKGKEEDFKEVKY
jgi:hypothetical protein